MICSPPHGEMSEPKDSNGPDEVDSDASYQQLREVGNNQGVLQHPITDFYATDISHAKKYFNENPDVFDTAYNKGLLVETIISKIHYTGLEGNKNVLSSEQKGRYIHVIMNGRRRAIEKKEALAFCLQNVRKITGDKELGDDKHLLSRIDQMIHNKGAFGWTPTEIQKRKKITPLMREHLSFRQDHKCNTCNKKLEPGWHADHRVPLVNGGKDDISNLQALCPLCHLVKTSQEAQVRANELQDIHAIPVQEANSEVVGLLHQIIGLLQK